MVLNVDSEDSDLSLRWAHSHIVGFVMRLLISLFRIEDIGLISDDHLIYRIKYNGDVEWEPPVSEKVRKSVIALDFSVRNPTV